jgi:hypothetical protein
MTAAAPAAHAQSQGAFQRDRNVTVRDRPRPDYDALGLRAGSFLIFPKVEASEAHEDNVFAEATNEKSDWVTSVAPSVRVESQWSRHALQARLQANAYRYSKYDDNSSTTLSSGLSGRLDVVRGTAITGGVGFDHLVEPRSSASSPTDAVDPVRYNQTSLDLGASREVNRLRLSGAVHYRNYVFQNTRSFLGTPINEKYRNNTSWEQQVRVDYALSPALALFATGTHNDWAFKEPTNPFDVDRDASGYSAAVGADFEVTQLVRGQVQAGYMRQKFDDPRVPDGRGLSLLGRVEYFPTQLLTVTANVERTVQATGVFQAGGVVHTALGLQGDYELLRNLIITARVQHYDDDYRGLARTDKIWSAALGANYLINRRLGVNVLYSRYDQNSNGLQRDRDFVTNRIQVGLVAQY